MGFEPFETSEASLGTVQIPSCPLTPVAGMTESYTKSASSDTLPRFSQR
jgi:hypothetical protein